jgi:hypothetical protein
MHTNNNQGYLEFKRKCDMRLNLEKENLHLKNKLDIDLAEKRYDLLVSY